MKTYRVNVNEKEYVVKVEEIGAGEGSQAVAHSTEPQPVSRGSIPHVSSPQPSQPHAPSVAPQSAPVAATPQAPETTASGEGTVIEAPIQGSIFKIVASAGDTVKAGDTLLILEAMKLENEIVAPQDGVVEAILVKEGQAVDAGVPLVSLK